jgi:flagellin
MVINTNMGALNAVRLMDQTSRDMATSMERLTTGQRINSSADDAAGLAIVTNMDTQIRGTEMAIRHANDGISVMQTLDGATEEVVSMMQRMRELAVQSMNGTYTDANRSQMDAEFGQLQNEIDRIAVTTKFNEQSLMDGTGGTSGVITIQVGWEGGTNNQITVSTKNFKVASLNTNASATVATISAASAALANIDKDLSAMNLQRSKMGAIQNRLEHTVSNLQNMNENMSAAKSRILDTDFAAESAALAKSQVLQQAGMSMLAKANQSVQQVTQLLQG